MDQAVMVKLFGGKWNIYMEVSDANCVEIKGAVWNGKWPVTNNEEWDKKDAKTQELIVVRLDEKPLNHILVCNTAK